MNYLIALSYLNQEWFCMNYELIGRTMLLKLFAFERVLVSAYIILNSNRQESKQLVTQIL